MDNNFEKKYNEKKFKDIEKETIMEKILPNYGFIFTDKYDYWDVTIDEIKTLLELKNRYFSSEFFDKRYNGEMLLEVKKCERLIKAVSEGKYKGYKAVYCFYFNNDVYQYIVLNNIDFSELKKISILCPKDSFNWDSEKIYKECYIIPKSIYNKKNFVRRKL
jgi:hypothetical protein